MLKHGEFSGLALEPEILERDPGSSHDRDRERIFRFFRLNLSPREVEYHWQRLLLHQSRFPANGGRKVDLRTAAFDYFVNETDLLVEPLVMESEELRQTELMAYFDQLTGLHNYAYFESEVKTEVARARRYQTSLCLLLLDLDGFKQVNDTLGHRKGNEVLRSVGQLLLTRLRSSDLVARFGGDEFAMLLHRTDPENGQRVAQSLCESIDGQFRAGPFARLSRPLTASCGLSALPTHAEDEVRLFELADQALYRAKRTGGNRVVHAS
ncbi:MAG TPA: GGDEF domain-containing protein [Vicinamibacteria bacterium]|nr:GGDEF domain-containing protein [Vicinamibacteria bacterium]